MHMHVFVYMCACVHVTSWGYVQLKLGTRETNNEKSGGKFYDMNKICSA